MPLIASKNRLILLHISLLEGGGWEGALCAGEKLFTPVEGDATAALQAAMEAAAAKGEALRLAAGRHACAGLKLPSGLDLRFSAGAVLVFAESYEAYAANEVGIEAEQSSRAMITAKDATNISITGPGLISAPGPAYVTGRLEDMGTLVPAASRPRVMVLENCKGVTLADFSVEASPMWTLHFVECEGLRISGLSVTNDLEMPNTDGMVLDACREVRVERCRISTADDGIVLKTSARLDGAPAGACRDIVVADCDIESRSCALKLGTESHGDFENIEFRDCRILGSNRALGIFSRDGGKVRNIAFRRIGLSCEETPEGFWGSGEAVTITVLDRRPLGTPGGKAAGDVRDVVFEDISGRMEGAVNLIADKPGAISGLRLSRIRLVQADGAWRGHYYDVRPTAADLAPSPDAAGRANAWVKGADGKVIGLVPYPGGMPGLYAHNVEGLVLEDVVIERPLPLPQGWYAQEQVVVSGVPAVWSVYGL